MGYVRGFIHGSLAGAALGLCVAPQNGRKTREQLSSLGTAAQEGYDLAQRTFRKVAPYASTAAGVAKEKVEKVRRHDNGQGIVELEGSVSMDTGYDPKGS
ncbi:MAG: hypothetical protein ABR564_05035 [Candidatus Dormibacteria bacterium]